MLWWSRNVVSVPIGRQPSIFLSIRRVSHHKISIERLYDYWHVRSYLDTVATNDAVIANGVTAAYTSGVVGKSMYFSSGVRFSLPLFVCDVWDCGTLNIGSISDAMMASSYSFVGILVQDINFVSNAKFREDGSISRWWTGAQDSTTWMFAVLSFDSSSRR